MKGNNSQKNSIINKENQRKYIPHTIFAGFIVILIGMLFGLNPFYLLVKLLENPFSAFFYIIAFHELVIVIIVSYDKYLKNIFLREDIKNGIYLTLATLMILPIIPLFFSFIGAFLSGSFNLDFYLDNSTSSSIMYSFGYLLGSLLLPAAGIYFYYLYFRDLKKSKKKNK